MLSDQIIKNKFGDNWILIEHSPYDFFNIVDLYSNIRVRLDERILELFVPESMFVRARGLLVEERLPQYFVTDLACLCDDFNKKQIVDMDSIASSMVKYNKCVRKCLRGYSD